MSIPHLNSDHCLRLPLRLPALLQDGVCGRLEEGARDLADHVQQRAARLVVRVWNRGKGEMGYLSSSALSPDLLIWTEKRKLLQLKQHKKLNLVPGVISRRMKEGDICSGEDYVPSGDERLS